jgi:exodeoxyribonuclease VII large subunit
MLVPIPQQETAVFTVSELNTRIKALLESNYRFVWVKGEISNFRIPASGHYYFTLKDEQSQIRGVFFRTQHRRLRFVPAAPAPAIRSGRRAAGNLPGAHQRLRTSG